MLIALCRKGLLRTLPVRSGHPVQIAAREAKVCASIILTFHFMPEQTRLTDTSFIATTGEPSVNADVLTAVRAATAARHELLHEIMPLSVDSVVLRDYLAHLAILREWLVPLEPWLARFSDGPQSPAFDAVHLSAQAQAANDGERAPRIDRLALIDSDLTHEAASAWRDETGTAPRVAPTHGWSGARSAAYRWGVCYVIEGSQLGGAVLYARLKDRLAPHPLGYLSAGRASLGPRWQAFTRAMSAEVHSPALIAEACEGAADAFDRLIELAQRTSRSTV
jgi:heme oxygenase (biliverdin-IX-beta and delta-forming)